MRGAAAQRAGDHATTIQAFEAVYASGKLSGPEQAQVAESLAYAYAQTKDLAKAQAWIAKAQAAGGNSAQLKQLQAWLQGQSGDHAAVARDAAAAVSSAEQSGQRPAEADLLRLADAQARGNLPGYNSHARKAARPLPEEGVLGRHPGPAAAQARLRRPLRARRDAAEAGQRHDEQDRGLHGNGAARAAGRRPGRGEEDRRARLCQRRVGQRRRSRTPPAAARPGAEAGRRKQRRDRRPRRGRRGGQGRQCAGPGRLCLRDHGRGRQGHRADRAGHRQGRPEAARGRQAAPGHGAAAVGQEQGQVARRRCAA